MSFDTIKLLPVLVAALSAFIIGGLWYSPILFAKAWMADNELDQETIRNGNKAIIFSSAFVFSLILAANLSLFISGHHAMDTHLGLTTGFHAGLFSFCAIAIHSLFELKPWRLIFINGGYSIVALMVMGTILGAWH